MEDLKDKVDELQSIVERLSDELDRVNKRLASLEDGPQPRDERAWHGAWQPWAGWCGGRER